MTGPEGIKLILFPENLNVSGEGARETLRFEGSKINCFRRDQSLSDLLYTVAAGNFKAGNSLNLL